MTFQSGQSEILRSAKRRAGKLTVVRHEKQLEKRMSNPKFYDKVAEKFGSYRSGAQRKTEFPNENPERVFDKKLIQVANTDSRLLDVGCADGRNILQIADHFGEVRAIDLSEGMLEAARKRQAELGIKNVIFEKQDAERTSFADGYFDIVGCRRGPAFHREIYRVLKPNGHFVHIFIGEQDVIALKKLFGRGQFYGQWETPFSQKEHKVLASLGFEITYMEDFHCDQYYASYFDLDLFLQSVPIFEDFDSKKDQSCLEKYVAKFQTAKGIRLPRHVIVSVAKKTYKVPHNPA